MTEQPQTHKVSPFCKDCGWRKGGVDSWDGLACKCGHSEPAIFEVTTASRKSAARKLARLRASARRVLAIIDQ